MNDLKLIKPTVEMRADALTYRQEYFDNGEMRLHGDALWGSMEYEEWLELIQGNSKAETVHENLVISDPYFVV